jgi:hypothetical protein
MARLRDCASSKRKPIQNPNNAPLPYLLQRGDASCLPPKENTPAWK